MTTNLNILIENYHHLIKMKKINMLLIVIFSLIIIIGMVIVSSLYLSNESSQPITGQAILKDDVKVKIGYREHLLYLPAYVAQKNNYYAEEGLEAELINFDSTNQLVEAVLSGNVDAAIGGVNAVVPLTIEGKTPGLLRIFNLGILTDDFDALVVAKNSNIKTIQDLEGKIISSLPGTAAKIWMDRMLDQEKLNGKITIIQTADSQQLNALVSGSVDAIFVLEPLATIAEEKNIGRILIKSPISKYFRTDLLFETSIMSNDFINKNPTTAKKIIRAIDKAIVFINNNPDLVRTYYSEFTPVEEDSFENKLPVSRYIPSYEMDINKFQETTNLFATSGLIEEEVNVSKILIQ
ncbi:ABC transporter substrate-binding protein [Candidatus Woesearchaeota archaeon]|nr:ABC transporter substrate-binding protein [Candidatus Woesearchaeota archaeon]